MIESRRAPRDLRSSEPFQLIAELVCQVSRAAVSELPQVLLRIVETVREVAGLRHSTVTLLDYISDQAYIATEAGEPWVHPIGTEGRFYWDVSAASPSGGPDSLVTVWTQTGLLTYLPIAVGSETVGALQILSNSKGISLSPGQERSVESLASVAAFAIDRCRTELARSHQKEWLDALSNVFAASRNATTEGDIQDLLKVIAENAFRISGADFVTLYEYFEEIDDVRLPPVICGPVYDLDVLQGRSVAVEHKKSIIFRTLALPEPLFADEAPGAWIARGFLGPAAHTNRRSFFHREGVVSSAGIPLRIEQERVGVLFINYRRERTFNREFRRHLSLFANQAALAIAHARFFLRSDRYSHNLEAIARRVVSSALGLLSADAGCLFLATDDSFVVAASYGHDEILLQGLQESLAREHLQQMTKSDLQQISFSEEKDIGDLRLLPDACSCVLVPIRKEIKDKRLLGFLLVESRAPRHFRRDQELLKILSSQAAASINRVELLEYEDRMRKGLLVSTNAIAVGQIATTFLHEAKNSLSSIRLTVQSVHEDLDAQSGLDNKEDYLDRLSAVQEEVARFDALSRRLQRFTRQDLKPEKKSVHVNDIVRQTLILLGSAIRSKGLELEKKLDVSLDNPGEGEGNPILADNDQIQQALMNLVLNAVAASGNSRSLLVETRSLAEHVEIRVTDHGEGIPSDVRGKLFKPFFTTKKDGEGLGLFLSQILVKDNHGGSIEIVSSAPGRGSTFAIRLPKQRP